MVDLSLQGASLHKKLHRLALEVEAQKLPLTIGDGLRRLAAGANGYGFPLLLLSLPATLPLPTSFGLKSLLGVIATLLGLQMLMAKRSVWLPQWFTRIRMRAHWSQHAARLGERFLPRLEHFVKHRMNWMMSRAGVSLLGLAVVFLGLIMIISIIPGSKIAAALILFALSVGLIERDGLLALLAAVAALILVALHAELVYLLMIWLED